MIRRGALVAVAIVLALLPSFGASSSPVTVRPGALVVRDVDGFAPSASVTLHVVGRSRSRTVLADSAGVVHLRFHAPSRPGPYRVTLTGEPAGTFPAPPAGSGAGDRQTVEAIVPRVAVIDVVARRGSGPVGVGGKHLHRGGGTVDAGPNSGPTAQTGSDVAALIEVGLAALLIGATVVMLARRRRPE